MFISYAQNFEDVMLWRALKHVVNGFYIDVGAAWPNEHSVTKAFYDAGWSGINVEPNPAFHLLLKQERPRDCNLLLALTEQEGSAEFVIFEATGLSTLDPVVAGLHQNAGRPHQTQAVTTSTLMRVWQQYVPKDQEVHFLKVDVEGAEAAVLRGNDWQKCRPWIVVVEATVPMSQVECFADWEPVLLHAQYRLAYADGLNRFYIASERADLFGAFQYPPNFFDNFKQSDHYAAELKASMFAAVAQQAKEQAEQAQERERMANARAEQAQEREKVANARAEQTRVQALVQQQEQQKRIDELGAQSHHWWLQACALEAERNALRQSASWRITAPLRFMVRWVMLSVHASQSCANRVLRHITETCHVLLSRLIAVVLRRPKLSYHINKWLLRYPALYQRLLGVARQGGVLPGAPVHPAHMARAQAYALSELANLSPRARQIYVDLQAAIEKNKRKN